MKAAGLLLVIGLIAAGVWLLSGPSESIAVRSIPVERADVSSVLTTNGRIEAAERADLYARAAGRVLRITVKPGDPVAAGALVAALDAGPAASQRQQAEARLAAARADLAFLERGLAPAERAEIETQIAAVERSLAAQD